MLENETIRVESEFAVLHSQLKKVADALKYLSEFEQNGLTYTVTQPELNGIPNTANRLRRMLPRIFQSSQTHMNG